MWIIWSYWISFLPVGHIHEDIDQLFSVIGRYLKTHDAYTIKDLIVGIKKSCATILEVIHIDCVAQIKQRWQKRIELNQ